MKADEEMYREYADYVFRYLLSLTGNRDTAEELTQETFFQAVKSIGRYDGSCRLGTWLCGIAKNVLAAYRRKNPETVPLEELPLTAPSSEEETLRQMERMALYRSLHACPEPQRELLYLRLFAGLSFREIGEIMGRTENWARVTFYRAKEMLKKEMETDG